MSGALRARKSCRFPVTAVTDGCELPTRYWEPNLGPPQELLTLLSLCEIIKNVVSQKAKLRPHAFHPI